MTIKHMTVLILSLSSSMTFSAPSEVNPRRAAGGMASEFTNIRLNQSSNPIPLTNKALTDSDKNIIKQAEVMFDGNASLSIAY